MNLKCPNCGGVIVLNPETGMMECTQCKETINTGFSIKKADLDVSDSPIDERTALEFAKKDRAERYLAESKNNITEMDDMGVGIDDDIIPNLVEEDTDGGTTTNTNRSADNIQSRTTYMKMDVYSCTSCGAKLMVNSKEAASFCAYCGQPTIIFERVSEEVQPDVVIPFSITKEKAVSLIKEKFMSGRFVPDEIKNFEIDKLRGIYIPFWLCSTNNRCKMNLSATRTERRNGKQYQKSISMYRDLECEYERITVDASRRLNDSISKRLEPYDLSKLVPFDIGYLSGFYADRYDVPADEAVNIAKQRSEEFIEKRIFDSCEDVSNIQKKSDSKTTNIADIEYAMLPAWFITFRYKGIIYTVVVNGQTGKVIGNVPVNKIKVGMALVFFMMLLTTFTTFLAVFGGNIWYADWSSEFYRKSDGASVGSYLVIGTAAFSIFKFIDGVRRARAYKQDSYRFAGHGLAKYVRKRQDKTWVR